MANPAPIDPIACSMTNYGMLRPCRGCKQPVDTTAKTCPKCGRPNPAGSQMGCLGVAGLSALVLVGTCTVLGLAGRSARKSNSEPDSPENRRTSVREWDSVHLGGPASTTTASNAREGRDNTGSKPPECSYLEEEGLPTGPWILGSDGGLCMSSTLDTGGSNAITFNVRGTRNTIKKIQLFEVISDKKQVRQAYDTLGKCAGTLLGKLSAARAKRFKANTPDYKDIKPLARAIDNGDTINGILFGMPVSLTHGKLPPGKPGWTVTLDITIPD